jgi:hypothetical protein
MLHGFAVKLMHVKKSLMSQVHAALTVCPAMQAARLVGFVLVAKLPSGQVHVSSVPHPPKSTYSHSQRADRSACERVPNVFVASIAGQESVW